MLGGVSLVPLVTVALSVRMDMKLIEKMLVHVVSYVTVLQLLHHLLNVLSLLHHVC